MAQNPRYDLRAVKSEATYHWPAIINRVAGIGDDYLTTAHGPCPKCGGNDRWRVFDDFDQTGGAICNQCGKFGDGLAVIQWHLGIGFPEAMRRVAEFLGTAPETSRGRGTAAGAKGVNGSPAAASPAKARGSSASHKSAGGLSAGSGDPQSPPQFKTIELLPWNDLTAGMWCLKKPGMSLAALKALGAQLARYRKRHLVIALPVIVGEQHVGWTLYEAEGKLLPQFKSGSPEPVAWLKVKTIKVK